MTEQKTFGVIVTYNGNVAPLVLSRCVHFDYSDVDGDFLKFKLKSGAGVWVKTNLVRSIETRSEN